MEWGEMAWVFAVAWMTTAVLVRGFPSRHAGWGWSRRQVLVVTGAVLVVGIAVRAGTPLDRQHPWGPITLSALMIFAGQCVGSLKVAAPKLKDAG